MADLQQIKDARDARIADLTALKQPIKDFFTTTKAQVSEDGTWKLSVLDNTLSQAQAQLDEVKNDINQMTALSTDSYGNDREAELRIYIAGLNEQLKSAITDLKPEEAAKMAEQIQTTIDMMTKEANEEHALKEKNMTDIVTRNDTRIDALAKVMDDAAAWVVPRPIDEVKKAAVIAADQAAYAEYLAEKEKAVLEPKEGPVLDTPIGE
jgi:hypothetical protein